MNALYKPPRPWTFVADESNVLKQTSRLKRRRTAKYCSGVVSTVGQEQSSGCVRGWWRESVLGRLWVHKEGGNGREEESGGCLHSVYIH